jgi:ketosteroid isomerase-like protein
MKCSFLQIFTVGAALMLTSCFLPKKRSAGDAESNRAELLKTDKEFSAMSGEKGMKNAFLEYIDSNGVLLRPNVLPVAGADAVDYLIATNDTGYTMTWQPKNAAVAESGDLGYTYGTYAFIPKNKDTTLFGTYVSIWKKNAAGKWKFVLDSGNEGIGEETAVSDTIQ